eukprot:227322-Pleurochrysis_carterae.AAC.3
MVVWRERCLGLTGCVDDGSLGRADEHSCVIQGLLKVMVMGEPSPWAGVYAERKKHAPISSGLSNSSVVLTEVRACCNAAAFAQVICTH